MERQDEARIDEVIDEPEEMPAELEEAEETPPERQNDDERYLRLAAEYDNFRKRTARERETLVSESQHFTIKQFLPVLDNLERAASQPCADEAYSQGIAMITRQWLEILEKLGVTPIDALNMPFDPNLHNAVMHGEDETLPENTIVEEFQRGYSAGDKVIRPSMVKVVN